MAQLKLDRVSKRYGHFHAVRDVSIDVAEGEFVVLLGPSGCGKTTTLRIIAGFVEPTAGAVSLGGKDITRLPERRLRA
jgi:putative spermidine/putrescine transport system ATP-binding protein